MPVTGWGQRRPPPPYRLKTDVCYVQTDGYKYTPNLRRRFDTTECGSRAAPARPWPTPARSLSPALGPGGEQQPAGGSGTIPSRMLRTVHVCPGDVGSPVAGGSRAWGRRRVLLPALEPSSEPSARLVKL